MQSDYHTMTWNTGNFASAAPKEQVSASDLNALLKGRRFGRTDVPDFDMCPPAEHFDPNDMMELESYCKSRGIVGVNFTGMNPKSVLRMLKGRSEGIYTEPSKRSILHG
jgi:hypothetical protein